MYIKNTFVFSLAFILTALCLNSQEVTISPDISIRNNVAYDIIGKIGDRILFYKEKGTERQVLLYDEDLVFQSERQINLDEKRCYLYEVVNLDTAFAVVYGYRSEGQDITKLDIFNNEATRIDSVTLTNQKKDWNGLNLEAVLSEDESKIALYKILDDNEIRLITADISKKKFINDATFKFQGVNLYNEILDIRMSDAGSFYMFAEINNTKSKKNNHVAHVYEFPYGSDRVNDVLIPLNDIVCQDLFFTINNLDNSIGIVGLYDDKRFNRSTGYFWLSGGSGTFDQKQFELIPFDEELYFEVYGERSKGRMENFTIADVIWKSDGTPIIAFEVSYDVTRRGGAVGGGFGQTSSSFNSPLGGSGAWSDHYRDDIVLVSIDRNSQKEWHQVFYKKQFSQNDNGAFSSFYPFITPSRLRLIYNDEIKNNSTVSEYILDGSGNYKRTSVLSTEYQNLRLRFGDAYQISSTELLVPSQKSYVVNIVKIDFAQ